LKAADRAGWPTGPAAREPREAATLLHEEFRELARVQDTAKHGADFAALLSGSGDKAAKLRDILRAEPTDSKLAATALKAVSASCADCHRKHRN
jgi:hypothetical protein